MAIHGLYIGRNCQHHRYSAEEVHELAWAFGGDPTRITVFHRPLFILAAVCRQVAQQTVGALKTRFSQYRSTFGGEEKAPICANRCSLKLEYSMCEGA